MQSTRPMNLDLIKFRFPIPAIASILHRVSGVVLFFGVGYLTYLLSLMLESEESFNWVFTAVTETYHGFFLWAVLSAALYHLLAGIRHILLDFHIGVSLKVGRLTSWFVLVLSVIGALAIGWQLIS